MTALAIDPAERGVVYCGSSRGNVYRSADGGVSWRATRPGNQFPGYVVATLRADARTSGTLWAALSGTEKGAMLAVSHDRGASWNVLARWEKAVNCRAFAQAAKNPEILACGGDDGVFLSRDEGKSWKATGLETPGLGLVQSLAFDPSDSRVLYAGTYRQAFRTKNLGEEWERIAQGMVLDATVYSFDFDPHDSRRIWVSTCGWVYRSDDGGDSWVRYTAGFTNRRTPVVHQDPRNSEVLYAGTVGGLHRSADGGKSWQRVSRETLDISALEIDPSTGRLWIGTQGEGVYVSDDGGTTLVPASAGLEEARVPALAADPEDPLRVLFLRAYGGVASGIWESQGGEVRQISADSPPGAFALAAVKRPEGSLWLCASASAVLVSTDGARRFSAPRRGPEGRILKVFGFPLRSAVVVTETGVFSSSDGSRFVKLATISGAPEEAEIVSREGARPELLVRTSSGTFRGEGDAFERSAARPLLSGGIFRKESVPEEVPFFHFDTRGDTLFIWRDGIRASLSLPRDALQVSGAVIAGDGSLYVATMGDGILRYTPVRRSAGAPSPGFR